MGPQVTHVVLVPGFWLAAWAWRDVLAPLRDAGLVPHAVTLPGLGPDDTAADRARVTRDDHLRVVTGLVESLAGGPGVHDEPDDARARDDRARDDRARVVLVGHSGGGALVGEVVDRLPQHVARVVYLDSGPLVDGARLSDPSTLDGPEIPLPPWDVLAAQGSSVDGIDAAGLERFRALARPQPAAVATTPVRVTDPARLDVPTTVVCTSLPSATLRVLASHAAPFRTELLDLHRLDWVDLPTGHWAMFSRPAELAAVLAEVALR